MGPNGAVYCDGCDACGRKPRLWLQDVVVYGALVDEKEEHSGLLTFQWRPRAPELLTKEEEAEVAKSIKKHWAQFEEADKLFSQRSSEQEKARRDELYQKWNERRARKKDILLKYQRILDSREGA